MSAATKPLPASWLNALRAIAANDWNPMGRADGVHSSIGRALLARGLCERKGARMPLTLDGRALLASLDAGGAPVWLVPLRSLVPDDDGGGTGNFTRIFAGVTAHHAHEVARVWCEAEGDCEVLAVEDVEGPLDVPAVRA